MRALIIFQLVVAVVSANVAAAQADLVGAWSREQHEGAHVVTTEISFGSDGAFSQSISFTPQGGTKRMPAFQIDGRWKESGGTITISMPSNAPIGVSPRPDRTVTWRIQKLSARELSVTEGGSKEQWHFSKKK